MSESPQKPTRKILEAIPVKKEVLLKAHLEVTELPVAQFPAGETRKDAVISVAQERKPVVEKRKAAPNHTAEAEERKPVVEKRTAVPKNRTAVAAERTPVTETRPAIAEERTPAFQQPPTPPEKGSSINRKALESTNRGKKPSSRRFVRGILHPSPVKVTLGAFFSIAVRFVFLASIVLGVLMLFDLVDLRLAWALLLLPVVALLHFTTVGRVRCRVCGIKEFVPSRAHKHVKTHHFLFFGPIISTALHLLLFKWFHCMFCGTAIRIKK